MIKHKYILRKSSWGIVIGIYGNVYDYDSYDFNAHILEEDGFTKLCEGVYVLFEKEPDNRIGPDDSYNQMHVTDYPYMLEGLHRVSGQILKSTQYQNTLIVIARLEFNLCDFQEEGLTAGMMEWAAKAFRFPCPQIEAAFQKDRNRYIYQFPDECGRAVVE